jgi:hypothetical protein
MANDIVTVAASIKIVVFISIDEKTALPLPWARARPRKSRGREEYSDRLVGFPSRQRVEQFQEAHGGFTIWLDPFGMLGPQVVVDLLPEHDVGVDFVRHGNWLIWNVHLYSPPLSRLPSSGVGSLHGGSGFCVS